MGCDADSTIPYFAIWVLPLPGRLCAVIQVDLELVVWLVNRKVHNVNGVPKESRSLSSCWHGSATSRNAALRLVCSAVEAAAASSACNPTVSYRVVVKHLEYSSVLV